MVKEQQELHEDLSAAQASNLCASCGLCCDGSLFYSVRLQPKDSPKTLIGLGLKLQRKRKQNYLLQPCSAFCGDHCSIYEHRPERCRAFECRQLLAVKASEAAPEDALARINQAKDSVLRVMELFRELGEPHEKRNILRRYAAICARVPDASEEPRASELKNKLTVAMGNMEEIFRLYFRVNKEDAMQSASVDGPPQGAS